MTARAGLRTVAVRGGELTAMVREGAADRPTLLLIHPANLRATCWLAVVRELDPDVRCVMPDLSGHGDSARNGRYGVVHWSEDCLRVLDHLGIDECHVVGASVGAAVAVALAVRRPTAVRSVGTVGGALRPAPEDGDPLLAAFAAGAGIAELRGEMARASVAAGAPAELIDSIAADVSDNDPHTAAAIWRAALDTDVAPSLRRLRAPAWSVVGAEDMTCPPAESRWFSSAVAGELVVLPGVGHLPMYEAPARLAALIGCYTSTIRR